MGQPTYYSDFRLGTKKLSDFGGIIYNAGENVINLLPNNEEEPEYYQDEIYEQLKAKFRPKIKIDPDTMLPVYDDTYKPVLDKVLERFDNYEDTYYDREDD